MNQESGEPRVWKLPEGIPRRWLMLTQYYAPEPGAPQTRLRTLTRILRDQGIDVEVLTAMPNYPTGVIQEPYRGKWTCTETIDGIPIRRTWVQEYAGSRGFRRLLNYFSFPVTALIALLCCRRPEVLFIESQPLPVGILGLLSRMLWGVPYIYNIPDLQIETARSIGDVKRKWILDIAAAFEDILMRNAWRVSTVTYRFRDLFHRERRIPRSKLTMLPNGADTRTLKRLDPDPELIERYGVAGKTVFVYAGTIARAHGAEILIEAADLIRHRDDIRILILGGGVNRQQLVELVRVKDLHNVIFGESAFDVEILPRLMSIARAAVLTLHPSPARYRLRVAKTWPALACGKPVIFTGECESGEMVKEHDCGLVTPPGDARAFADAILRLADDEEEANRLGHNGRRFVEDELDWLKIVQRWLDEIMQGGFPSARRW